MQLKMAQAVGIWYFLVSTWLGNLSIKLVLLERPFPLFKENLWKLRGCDVGIFKTKADF